MQVSLQSYLSMLLAASVLGAVCATFAGGKFEKYLRYLASLICILLVLSPFRSWNADALLHPDNETGAFSLPDTATLELRTRVQTEKQISRQIAVALSAWSGISNPTVRIDMEWTEQEAIVTAIHVTLEEASASRTAEITDYLTHTYGVPADVQLSATSDSSDSEKE